MLCVHSIDSVVLYESHAIPVHPRTLVQAAQEREELQVAGDALDAKISKAEAEVWTQPVAHP